MQVSTFKDFMPDMKQFVSQLQESSSLQNAIVVEQVSIVRLLSNWKRKVQKN